MNGSSGQTLPNTGLPPGFDPLGLPDIPATMDFDDLLRLVSYVCHTRSVLVWIPGDPRGRLLDGGEGTFVRLTKKAQALCREVIETGTVFEADGKALQGDALLEPLESPPGLFAGMPFMDPRGRGKGALVVMDPGERRLEAKERNSLEILAGELSRSLELDQTRSELQKLIGSRRKSQRLEALGRLAGGIAHDFNNHLTAILGFSDMLLGPGSEQNPNRHELEEIRKAANRASLLTRQLLAFCRKQPLKPRDLNLNDLVRGMENMLRELITRNITLRVIADPGLQNVRVDASGMEQVVMNLALNARDAMPGGGKLTIVTSNIDVSNEPEVPPGKYVLLAVCDTGHGMSEETASHIFEPFFTQGKKGKGTGLGLATVYGTVRQSGGYVLVDSKIGRGTTFQVFLPQTARTEKVKPPLREKPVAERKGGGETILLVDDEPSVRMLGRAILARNGYVPLVAANGRDALKLFETRGEEISLVLTDVMMPEMDGVKLARAIRARSPEMRIIFMTGLAETLQMDGLSSWGEVTLVEKPFRVSRLTNAVNAALGRE